MNYSRNLYFLFLCIFHLGCTNKYLNSAYFQHFYSDKKLVVLPPRIDDLIISDSSVIDFISKDFNVKADSAIVILDSLIHRNIEHAFIVNTDNITIMKCNYSSGTTILQNTQNSHLQFNDQSTFQKLKKLYLTIPSRQSLIESGIDATMALVIGQMDLDISFEVETSFGIPKGRPSYKLEADNTIYALWDYDENRLVGCGKVDISSKFSRCDQLPSNVKQKCDNKFFWNYLLFALGNELVSETPFDKQVVDSIMDGESWNTMKKVQFREPLRDSTKIAKNIRTLCSHISTFIAAHKQQFSGRDTIRCRYTLAPDGRISYVTFLDSIRFDSAASVALKNDLDISFDEPITNQKHFTMMTIRTNVHSPEQCYLQSVHHGELRSKASIMKIVMQELHKLRYAYNRRLTAGMDKNGKISVKFTIDEYGKVISVSIEESTVADHLLENDVAEIIRTWRFGRIYNKVDKCEVVYPFIFSR